jgi:hypothetical protein
MKNSLFIWVCFTPGAHFSHCIGETTFWLKMMPVGRSTEESYNQPLIPRRTLALPSWYNILTFLSSHSFSYEMVWDETQRLYNQMVAADEWPSVSGEVKAIPHAQYMTQRLALCVILSCGFGLPLGWKEEAYTGKDKEKVNLDDGVKFQSDNAMLVCFAPKWVLNLPFEKYVTFS